MAGFSRRRFTAGVAAFAGCAMVGTEAFAHGRKGKARHGGRKPRPETDRRLAAAEPVPAGYTAPAPETVAPANLDTLGRLDPEGLIRKPLLAAAIVALDRHKDRITDPEQPFIADFSKHSSAARLYSVDMTTGDVTAFRHRPWPRLGPEPVGLGALVLQPVGLVRLVAGRLCDAGRQLGPAPRPARRPRRARPVQQSGQGPGDRRPLGRLLRDPVPARLRHAGPQRGLFRHLVEELAELMPEMGQGRLLYAGV